MKPVSFFREEELRYHCMKGLQPNFENRGCLFVYSALYSFPPWNKNYYSGGEKKMQTTLRARDGLVYVY